MRLRFIFVMVLLLAPVAFGAESTGAAPPAAASTAPAAEPEKATAADLIRQARRAVGQVVKAARVEKTLDREASDAKPFWNAMKELNEALDRADTGLTLKDETFFTSLATAGAAMRQAQIALEMNEAKSPAMRESMDTLLGIVRTLNGTYSKEAARLAQGRRLTNPERRQLARLKAQQADLERKLRVIEEKTGKNDARIREGTRRIRENSRRIRNARSNVGDFVGAMLAARVMSELIWGWHWWWGPWGWWCPGYVEINIIVWDDWIVACPYDWDLVDYAVDVDHLELETLDIYGAEVEAMDMWLEESDFSVESMDMMALTDDLPVGWDEVDSAAGIDMMHGFESNFDHMLYEPQFEMNTFDDFGGIGDFGGGFEAFGGGFDDIGGFDF